MNGVEVFLYGVAYGQLLAGSSGGGDEPNRPYRPPKSAHETTGQGQLPASSRRRRRRSRTNDEAGPGDQGPCECPVCQRRFRSKKAVHGHQRNHPERPWRGMEPQRPVMAADADGKQQRPRRRYACERCGAQFDTRQALGGHRASHSGRLGCHWLSKQQQEPAVAEKMPAAVLAFDLNEPAVPEQEEEE
ncbi:hypothetical protein U9M48_026108 [Paspalum notatum var. saurae]|uniref:C2H2-type domain-containing protein n=1 Tax=Paspalum notatum var. saurae TaxID=547442 RepID=A0AAQ3TS71_PASNO